MVALALGPSAVMMQTFAVLDVHAHEERTPRALTGSP